MFNNCCHLYGGLHYMSDCDCVYELMIKQFSIKSIIDLKIKWHKVYQWLGSFQWISRSIDSVISYLAKKGVPYGL